MSPGDVPPGNASDAEQGMDVVEASEAATGCQVVEVLGDCAYRAGGTHAEFTRGGANLDRQGAVRDMVGCPCSPFSTGPGRQIEP